MIIADLLARDLSGLAGEPTEYIAANRIKAEYERLFSALTVALKSPDERVGIWISGPLGSGKSSFAKNLAYVLANRDVHTPYEIFPVNPREKEILGRPSYRSLGEVPRPIEIVDIFREPSAVPAIVEEAIAVGAKVIWMQLGVIQEQAAERALQAGLEVVMDRCVKIEHARFFGGLSTLGLNAGVISARKVSPA